MHSVPESSCHGKLWAVVSAQSTLFLLLVSHPGCNGLHHTTLLFERHLCRYVPTWKSSVSSNMEAQVCRELPTLSGHEDFKGRLGNTK